MERNLRCFIYSLTIVVALALLAACGGGSSGSSTGGVATPPPAGRFVDGPVEGLGYKYYSSSIPAGLTGANGSLSYRAGKPVTFFVGNIELGSVPACAVITPIHLAPSGSDLSTFQVVNVVRFLLSIGNLDPNSGRITIPSSVTTAAAKESPIDFSAENPAGLDNALIQRLTSGSKTLVSIAEAQEHFANSIYQEFGGKYQGTFTGEYVGRTWEISIAKNGAITGMGSNQEKLSGTMTLGTIFNCSAEGGCKLEGKLDITSGLITGTWYYPGGAPGGEFTGKKL